MRHLRGNRNRLLAVSATAIVAASWLPAVAGSAPVPPACDPTVVGVGVPACPSVLLDEVETIGEPEILLPDLVPDTTEVYVTYDSVDFDAETGDWIFGPPRLHFNTRSQNLGKAALDVRADEPDKLMADSSASQCIAWTKTLVCRERTKIGGFTWHGEHRHFHVQDFATYELRALLPDGQPDFSESGLLATSPKVSFCLVDSVQVDPAALPTPRYPTCTPVSEGISPGWADVYPTGIEGQSLSLTGIPNGRYALVLTLNPGQRIIEVDTTNNRVIAVIDITKIGALMPEAAFVSKSYG